MSMLKTTIILSTLCFLPLYASGPQVYGQDISGVETLSELQESEQKQKDREVQKLNEQVRAHYTAGEFAEALLLVKKELVLLNEVYGEDSLESAQARNDLAEVLEALGEYDEAQKSHEKALSIREGKLGLDDLLVAESCNNLAYVLQAKGEYSKAIGLSRRALMIREEKLEKDHLDVATSLENLAGLLADQGDYITPLSMYERVLKIREKKLGPEHVDVSTALSNLAFLLEDRGDYASARPLYERAIEIEEKASGPEHPNLATTLSNLAHLLHFQGDYDAAKPLYERALKIREKSLPPSHPFIAQSLNNLAYLLEDERDYEHALPLYERSLSIREKSYGADKPAVATALNNLARLLALRGKYIQAQRFYERALRIRKEAFGSNHIQVAESLTNLATLFSEMGYNARAKSLCKEAVDIFRRSVGAGHPSYVRALSSLALIYLRSGDRAKAEGAAIDSVRYLISNMDNVLYALSFAEQRAFLEEQVQPAISLLISTSIGSSSSRLIDAYGTLMYWKGLLVFSLRRQAQFSKLTDNPTYNSDVASLREVRAQLSDLYQDRDVLSAEDWRERSGRLNLRKESIERKLSRLLGNDAIHDPLRDLEAKKFQLVVAPGEVFVDIYRYSRVSGKSSSDRFIAFLISGKANPKLLDLGSTERIVSAISQWRKGVLAGERTQHSWRALADLVWRPLAQHLPPGTRRAWISPDGELSRLPWHLLPETSEQTRVLRLGQVDSPRELYYLKFAGLSKIPDKTKWLIVGGLDFGSPKSNYQFLPGTQVEVARLQGLAVSQHIPTVILEKMDATKQRTVEELSKATHVHLATHGFFYHEDEELYRELDTRFRSSLRESTKRLRMRSPLVESGIALSGANNREVASYASRGILTAEELVGLNFDHCDLFVLSACDTGRGEEVTGQGVMGLRASIISAGARSVLMSLWKVPDAATEKLMVTFYEGLFARKLSKLEALLQAQEAVRNDSSGELVEPINWAGWILIGEAW